MTPSRARLTAIWRELMAINLQAQRPIEIALHATRHPERMQLMARARFGTIIPVRKSASPEAALERARTGKAIAMIEIGDDNAQNPLHDRNDAASSTVAQMRPRGSSKRGSRGGMRARTTAAVVRHGACT